MSDSAALPASSRVASSRPVCRAGWTWGHAFAAAALMGAGVLATLDAWKDILYLAMRDEEQSHIFLVPVMVAWLFWVRRERFRGCVPGATWVGPAVILLGWIVNQIGDRFLVQSFWHGGAILVVVGGFLSVAGGTFLMRFLPVFASLIFLVPVPGRIQRGIALPLQSATAAATQTVLETLGVTVERSGNMLTINNHDVMIAEACNGLRMVFALVMVSFAFSFGVPLRNRFRLFVLVASPITAIVFNVARLVPTVWAFGWLPTNIANSLHDASGWVMLPCAFVALLGFMRLFRWAQIPVTPYVLAYGY